METGLNLLTCDHCLANDCFNVVYHQGGRQICQGCLDSMSVAESRYWSARALFTKWAEPSEATE